MVLDDVVGCYGFVKKNEYDNEELISFVGSLFCKAIEFTIN